MKILIFSSIFFNICLLIYIFHPSISFSFVPMKKMEYSDTEVTRAREHVVLTLDSPFSENEFIGNFKIFSLLGNDSQVFTVDFDIKKYEKKVYIWDSQCNEAPSKLYLNCPVDVSTLYTFASNKFLRLPKYYTKFQETIFSCFNGVKFILEISLNEGGAVALKFLSQDGIFVLYETNFYGNHVGVPAVILCKLTKEECKYYNLDSFYENYNFENSIR